MCDVVHIRQYSGGVRVRCLLDTRGGRHERVEPVEVVVVVTLTYILETCNC
jgi:hypothetical protein